LAPYSQSLYQPICYDRILTAVFFFSFTMEQINMALRPSTLAITISGRTGIGTENCCQKSSGSLLTRARTPSNWPHTGLFLLIHPQRRPNLTEIKPQGGFIPITSYEFPIVSLGIGITCHEKYPSGYHRMYYQLRTTAIALHFNNDSRTSNRRQCPFFGLHSLLLAARRLLNLSRSLVHHPSVCQPLV
jgi:hypothetical protein